MSRQWGERVQFLTVYVREAHPVSDEQKPTKTNARAEILFPQPTSFPERCAIAERCQAALQLESDMVVDDIKNSVSHAYAAAPDRLYVVDSRGRIAYAGAPGPFGFNPSEMEQSLQLLLLAETE